MRKAVLASICILIFSSCIGASGQILLPSGGGDLGAQINNAIATLPATGGKILIQNPSTGQCYSFITPVLITKPVILEGQGPSTCLQFAGNGIAVSLYGNTLPGLPSGTYADGWGLRDLTLVGSGSSGSQTGLQLGGTTDSVGFWGSGITISNFGTGLRFERGVWNFKVEHSTFGANGQNVYWPSALHYGGENVEFDNVTFVGSTFVNSVEFNDAGTTDFSNLMNLTFVACNFDDAQLVINNGSGGVRLYSPHFENPQKLSGSEPFVRIQAFTTATDVVMDGPDFYNDANNPYPPSFLEIDGGPNVTITQMRSVNLDGSTNVPTNILIAGDAKVSLFGDATLRAAQQQFVVASGNPNLWVMGGQDNANQVQTQGPMMYSQTYSSSDSESPVVQIGGSDYQPTIGFDLWSGSGNNYYGMQIKEPGPGELDFCSAAPALLTNGSYNCNAGVVNGVFKSTVPDGTAPFNVASHTPPNNLNAWPATFGPDGTQIQNPHILTGKVILPPSGRQVIVFASSVRFTQTPSCTVSYQTDMFLVGARNLTSNPGMNGLTIFGQPYIGVYYMCIGN